MRLRTMVPIGWPAGGAVMATHLSAAVLAFLVSTTAATRASAQVQPVSWPSADVMYPSGQGGRVTGPILSRRGDDILVRDESSKQLSVVTLTGSTKIERPSGFLKMDKKRIDPSTLIPGLVIVVKGSGGDRGNLVADKITFHKGGLKTASQAAAGDVELKARLNNTAVAVDANADSIEAMKVRARIARDRALDSLAKLNNRLENFDKYDTKFTTTVNFATGSWVLDQSDKSALDELASRAAGIEGYKIVIMGFTDITGSVALNQRLSRLRAEAVVAYLAQQHSIPLVRIVTPAGLGATQPVGSNETTDGRAQNRRAEVKIIVNRGINPNP